MNTQLEIRVILQVYPLWIPWRELSLMKMVFNYHILQTEVLTLLKLVNFYPDYFHKLNLP